MSVFICLNPLKIHQEFQMIQYETFKSQLSLKCRLTEYHYFSASLISFISSVGRITT